MPAKATEREDDESSDWLTDDGQSEEDEFNKELSGWKEMERDDTDVERALSRVMHVLASSAEGERKRKAKYAVKAVFRAIREAHRAAASDVTPTQAQIDALIKLSTTLERKSLHSGTHGNAEFLGNAITAAEIAVQAIPRERPELTQRLDSLSEMLAGRWRWASDASLDRAIQMAERAVELTPTGDLQKITRLQTVSKLYEERFERGGRNMADLEQAISNLQKITQEHSELDQEVLSMVKNNIACLQFKGGDTAAVASVLEIPFEDLGKTPLSLADIPPYHFRFLDCRALVQQTVLRVLNFEKLPAGRYTAISYVWRGLRHDEDSAPRQRFMAVKGAEDADPISLALLRTACLASLMLGCEMLWLDRLCVMQENDSDKSWQIKNMYSIYQSCRTCLVLPGGLVRLATLSEETSWIHRAWTLQEAIAPPSVQCVFSWALGETARLQSHFFVVVDEIEPGTSGMTTLRSLLQGTLSSPMNIKIEDMNKPGGRSLGRQHINILSQGSGPRDHIMALLGALDHDEKPLQTNAIWRSALMRSSSRPVDMVFSIMGLLGVTLEPSSFAKTDRHRATIELTRALLAKGEPARWLAISLSLDPNPHMSTMPVMPETSVEGKAYVKTPSGRKEVVSLVGSSWWWLKGPPKGSMDEKGYFKFSAKAAPVFETKQDPERVPAAAGKKKRARQKPDNSTIKSESGKEWTLLSDSATSTGADVSVVPIPSFAVVIGREERYADGTIAHVGSLTDTVVMFIEEHAPGKWHNVGYGLVNGALVAGWAVREFEVGGPKPV